MGGTGSGFNEGGVNIAEVLDLEHPASYLFKVSKIYRQVLVIRTRISAVFSKAPAHGDAMDVEVLAEQLIATAAVEALATELRVICNNTITNLEGLDFRA